MAKATDTQSVWRKRKSQLLRQEQNQRFLPSYYSKKTSYESSSGYYYYEGSDHEDGTDVYYFDDEIQQQDTSSPTISYYGTDSPSTAAQEEEGEEQEVDAAFDGEFSSPSSTASFSSSTPVISPSQDGQDEEDSLNGEVLSPISSISSVGTAPMSSSTPVMSPFQNVQTEENEDEENAALDKEEISPTTGSPVTTASTVSPTIPPSQTVFTKTSPPSWAPESSSPTLLESSEPTTTVTDLDGRVTLTETPTKATTSPQQQDPITITTGTSTGLTNGIEDKNDDDDAIQAPTDADVEVGASGPPTAWTNSTEDTKEDDIAATTAPSDADVGVTIEVDGDGPSRNETSSGTVIDVGTSLTAGRMGMTQMRLQKNMIVFFNAVLTHFTIFCSLVFVSHSLQKQNRRFLSRCTC
jgi:hypothetical protein